MITMIYKQEPYNYGSTGAQNYSVDMKIEMVSDASSHDILDAVVDLMKAATYHVDVRTLAGWLQNYAFEHNQEKELNEMFGYLSEDKED